MEVVQVLHMNGGVGETSYASNSVLQKKVIALTKSTREQAIVNLYCSSCPITTLCIADLGCSSGPNTFLVISELMEVVHKLCKKLGKQTPEFQVYLNDLPGNDFNTIFMSVPSFQNKLSRRMGLGFGGCFVNGVPGSFYNRLFPARSLHFVHSSYSLMWLSQVPDGIESNKGNIYMASSSPPSVLDAYYEQFQRDFSLFLKCRSEELVAGGRMVLTILGRKSDDRSSKECCYIWQLLAVALNQMVEEGIIGEERLDSFNIPQYSPSPAEVQKEVQKEGSFTINHSEVSRVHWSASGNEFYPSDEFKEGGYNVAKCIRAVAESMLVTHFGESIIDEVFERYGKIVADRMVKEKTEFYNVTVSMTRN